MKKLKIKITPDSAFHLLTAFALCYDSIFFFAVIILKKLPIIGQYYWLILSVLVLMLLAYASGNRKRFAQIRSQDLLLILVFFFAIELTYLIYPQNKPYIQRNLWTYIIPCIPYFFLGLSFSADEEAIDSLSWWSKVAIVVAYVYMIINQRNGIEANYDSMNSSYRNLFCVMMTFDCALRKRRAVDWIFAVLGVFYILAMGTRGPLIIIFSFVALSLWHYGGEKKWIRYLLLLVAMLVAMIVTERMIYTAILNAVGNFLERFGLSRRIIDYMLIGRMVSDSSGRDDYALLLLQELKTRPILGYGVYGEWVFINYFCHNTYLEVVFDYGVLVGTGLIIAYVVKFYSAIRLAVDRINKQWLILWGGLVFIRGIFGGTHLRWEVFFLLGCCLHTIRAKYGEPADSSDFHLRRFPIE